MTSSPVELITSTLANSTTLVGNGTGSITVLGTTLNGTSPVNGVFVELRIDGTEVASGYTPVAFENLTLGTQYGVVVYWFTGYYIRYINDSNTGIDLQRYDLVTLSQSAPTDTLRCYFEHVPQSQAASLNILAKFPNGTQIGNSSFYGDYILHSPGMWLTLTPPNSSQPYTGAYTGGSILPFIVFDHENYTVDMSLGFCGVWYTGLDNGSSPVVDIVWSNWLNSSSGADRTVSMNGNTTIVAIFDQIYQPNCGGNTQSGGSLNEEAILADLLPAMFLLVGTADFLNIPDSLSTFHSVCKAFKD